MTVKGYSTFLRARELNSYPQIQFRFVSWFNGMATLVRLFYAKVTVYRCRKNRTGEHGSNSERDYLCFPHLCLCPWERHESVYSPSTWYQDIIPNGKANGVMVTVVGNEPDKQSLNS